MVVCQLFCSCSIKRVSKEVNYSIKKISIPDQIMPQKSNKNIKTIKSQYGSIVNNITVSKSCFNPTLNEYVAISFIILKTANVTIHVYDSDSTLIKTIIKNKKMTPGKHSVKWNGKDIEGYTIPDEAYFFTLIAKDKFGVNEIYDPTTFSGGIEYDLTNARIDPQSHAISYKMSEIGRVMIRMGIRGGPLLKTLVDWEPRTKGLITEHWNGNDEDNIIDIYNHNKFKMIIVYFTLPHNSIISFGNKKYTYLSYKRSITVERQIKPKRNSLAVRTSPHYDQLRTKDYTPNLLMNFSNILGKDKNGIPKIKGKTLVKVALSPEDKKIFQNSQFEICFFLDFKFYVEDESGYTPFNWMWDLSNIPEGYHIMTVNLSTFNDQIGVISKKVLVLK